MKKCNEVMTKNPVCCLPTDMVAKAAQLMKSENIGSIPVIENEQTEKLIGIVTDRDLALRIVAEGRDAKSTKVEIGLLLQGVERVVEDAVRIWLPDFDHRIRDRLAVSIEHNPGERDAFTRGILIHQITLRLTKNQSDAEKWTDRLAC